MSPGKAAWMRGALTRRRVLAGAALAGVAAVGVRAATSRRWRCFLFPPAHEGVEESRGVTEREDIFTGAPFAACHASTVEAVGEAVGGGLVAAWFGGSKEGEPDVAIWSAVRGAEGWSAPRLVARGAGPGGEAMPCWNPVLWRSPEGPLLLFYKVGPSPRAWWGMVARSTDGGRSWAAPARLPDGILGPVRSKPLLMDDGRLLCPSSTEHDGWQVHFEWTPDLGATWERTPAIGDPGMAIIQPTLLRHGEGRLQALCRSREGRVAELWSEDGGRTWSAPRLTDLPNPNSAIDAVTLADGRHLLVHNPVARCRSPLVVSVSADGAAWREVALLEDARGEFSYPAAIQGGDGLVRITYTNRRETIRHVTMDPAAF